MGCGTTGTTIILTPTHLHVAWAGDTEAVLIRQTEIIDCCRPLHKASDPGETQKIQERGGFVERDRVMGALAVSRAFGNIKYRQFITSEPDLKQYTLDGSEEYLVLACDGLWDVMTSMDVRNFLYQFDGRDLPFMNQQLVMKARSLGSTDNISCILLKFNEK
eukprot:Lithocolla_globosa_v1_NODE_10334_length_610_cov_1.726126.p2 type:complete len:162 gc:universal NODE_10334_length_610_cov_1.726126:609-124(-)